MAFKGLALGFLAIGYGRVDIKGLLGEMDVRKRMKP